MMTMMMEATTMLQRNRIMPREQIEQLIEYLAATYPKAFFRSPHLKRPLKKNIIVDLEKDNVLDDDRRAAAVSFYMGDWNYERTLLAGAKRLDLNGKEVGTVTKEEQIEAQKRVQAGRQALKEKQASPVEVVRKLHADGTDELSKITAPPIVSPTMAKPKTPEPPPANGLAELRALWSNIDSMLSNTADASLQSAVAAAALKVFIAKANKLITTLEEKST
jgi:sRNA-binding protein